MGTMARVIGSYAVIALLGALTALVGAGAPRAVPWFGGAAGLIVVGAAAVFARSWRGFGGLGVIAAVWAAITIPLATVGPGGSVLIAGDALGMAWEFGGAGVLVAVSMVPRALLVGREEGALT